MNFLYLLLYRLLFNPILVSLVLLLFLPVRKVRETLFARSGLWKRIREKIKDIDNNKPLIWFHVSSAGEYLQAKYLIHEFNKQGFEVFVTLTSISGYRWLVRENNHNLKFDLLPFDFSFNVRRLFKILNPRILIIVKNDIWPNLIAGANKRKIPVLLICAPERSFHSPLKKAFYRFLYSGFTGIFTITEKARNDYKSLLNGVTIDVMGDSKFDLVKERQKDRNIKLNSIKKSDICIMLGSIWPQDLNIIEKSINRALIKFENLKVIIAPHEMDKNFTQTILHKFRQYSPILYSEITGSADYSRNFKLLVVDTIGDLFFLYANCSIAYVGGGFSTGIHNILEPAAMRNAVIFGSRYQKFPEAQMLINEGCAYSINSAEEFDSILFKILEKPLLRKQMALKCEQFILKNTGSTHRLFKSIKAFIRTIHPPNP